MSKYDEVKLKITVEDAETKKKKSFIIHKYEFDIINGTTDKYKETMLGNIMIQYLNQMGVLK